VRLASAAQSTPPLRSSTPLAPAPAPDPSVDFRAAMAALDVGDNHQAAAAFASFVERHRYQAGFRHAEVENLSR